MKILVAQNERLKEALMKLKDISLSEKQEQERHVQILEKELEVIPSLKGNDISYYRYLSNKTFLGDIADLAEKLDTKEKQIEALKSDLDELKDLQDKFEELFDKHMNLQEENKELKSTIEELEQLRELADEVEESQAANEKKLRSELCKFLLLYLCKYFFIELYFLIWKDLANSFLQIKSKWNC